MERGFESLIQEYYRQGVKAGFWAGMMFGAIFLTFIIALFKLVL